MEKANKKLLEQQKSLKDINRNLQPFYDHSPDLSAIVDLESGKVLSCNNSFCQFLNTTREKAIGSNIYSFHASESYNALYNTLLDLETHGKVSKYQDFFLLNSSCEKVPTSLSTKAAFSKKNQKVALMCWHFLGKNQGRNAPK